MPRDECRVRVDWKLETRGVLVFRLLYQLNRLYLLGGTMNNILVKLIRKYEDRAERVKTRPLLAEFYRNAAKQVLALAMQQ
jgi:hypothetical protein